MKILKKLFDIYMIIFFALVFIINIYFIVTEKINVLYIIPVCILLVIIYLVIKLKIPHYGLIIFLFSLVTKIAMIIIVDTPPISDFSVMFDAGKMFAVNDYSFKDFQYFSSFPYQTIFAVYQGLIIKIFGANVFVLKAINCLFIAATNYLVYRIGKSVFNEYVGRIASAFHALYIPLFFMAPVLTNQHIATLFFYIGLYFIVKEKGSYSKWIIGGIFIAVGNTMRPIGIVFIAAIFIRNLLSSNKAVFAKHMKQFVIFLLSYLIVFYGISGISIATGVTYNGLKNNNPYWKFVTGLNEQTSGRFSSEDAKTLQLYEEIKPEELFENEKKIIMERLTIPPDRMLSLMVNKIRYMWGDYELGVFTFPHLIGKGIERYGVSFDYIYRQSQELEKIFYTFIIGFLLFGLIRYFRDDKNKNVYLLYYIFTAYTGAHLLIEISFRYKYAAMPILFILAGNGAFTICNRIKDRKKLMC
ncbi:membrane protein [Vallitalea longa]|uniref:Membrane protein n=1 Tax=Vallitalea longa TaxID=2936439 RepID=A0A9W5Y9M1_9FIRM|nr:glycosyltransferase family 39 protein [Vallitalea longa]GKX28580.1 membrane protein [Vallitalea longa]